MYGRKKRPQLDADISSLSSTPRTVAASQSVCEFRYFLFLFFYSNTFPVNNLADILGRYPTTASTDQLNCSKYSAFACLRKVGELWEQIELLREHICHLWCGAQNLPDHMMALLLYASLRQTGLSITAVTAPPRPLLTAVTVPPQPLLTAKRQAQ